MCGLKSYRDASLIPPDTSRSVEQALAFEHCMNMQYCWGKWYRETRGQEPSEEEPYEWLGCSDSSSCFEYCDDPYLEDLMEEDCN